MEFAATFLVITAVQLLRYVVLPGTAFLLVTRLARSWAEPRRLQSVEFRRSDLRREAAFSLGTVVVFGAVLTVTVTPLMPPIHVYTSPGLHGWLWLLLSLPFLMLVHDAYFYWAHRLMHHRTLFGRVHRIHHLSTNPSPLAALAFHPVEAFVETAWILPVFFLVPIHTVVLLIFGVFSMAYNVLGHLSIEIFPKSWAADPVLRWLNTSTHHYGHHQKFRGNYGLYFLFWDRLMGTEIDSRAVALDETKMFDEVMQEPAAALPL